MIDAPFEFSTSYFLLIQLVYSVPNQVLYVQVVTTFCFYLPWFKAYPSGTFFYHSHIGGQRVDGLFGAFIVKEQEIDDKGIDGIDHITDDFIMHVGDWYHKRSSEV